MAITNAQQYQQLVNKPANGKRPGYRGDAAYRSRSAQSSPSAGGQGNVSTSSERGDGDGTNNQGVYGDSGKSDYGQFRRRAVQNQQLKESGFLGKDLGMNIGEQDNLAKFGDFINRGGVIGSILSSLIPSGGTRPPPINTFVGGGGNEPVATELMPLWMRLGFNSEAEYLASLQEQESMDQEPEEEPFQLARAFRADGGIMGGLADGQMDEMGRQMYGLGKLVKKATRAVKKIVKSPVGKAALLYTGAGALGNLATGSGLGGMFKGFMTPSSFISKSRLGSIFSGQGLKNILVGAEGIKGLPGSSGLLGASGKLGFGKVATLASVLPFFGLGTGDESEEEAKKILDNSGISPEEFDRLRNDIDYQNQVLNRSARAGGGIMRLGYQEGGDAEPVAKKTMPLLDMDGKEKDYRETGGFVDMGRMERADDVPARLSKNEFVFTADAVRNAGDGNIDKGAEVMYNMMKNLENGGDVSEESQGLEGAKKMFQTSQRLEEVL